MTYRSIGPGASVELVLYVLYNVYAHATIIQIFTYLYILCNLVVVVSFVATLNEFQHFTSKLESQPLHSMKQQKLKHILVDL